MPPPLRFWLPLLLCWLGAMPARAQGEALPACVYVDVHPEGAALVDQAVLARELGAAVRDAPDPECVLLQIDPGEGDPTRVRLELSWQGHALRARFDSTQPTQELQARALALSVAGLWALLRSELSETAAHQVLDEAGSGSEVASATPAAAASAPQQKPPDAATPVKRWRLGAAAGARLWVPMRQWLPMLEVAFAWLPGPLGLELGLRTLGTRAERELGTVSVQLYGLRAAGLFHAIRPSWGGLWLGPQLTLYAAHVSTQAAYDAMGSPGTEPMLTVAARAALQVQASGRLQFELAFEAGLTPLPLYVLADDEEILWLSGPWIGLGLRIAG